MFTNSQISSLSGLGGVRETSDWSVEKNKNKSKKKRKNNKKVPY